MPVSYKGPNWTTAKIFFAARAAKESWHAARFLATLTQHEMAELDRRRIERRLGEAHLPAGKTLDAYAFEAVPVISKAQVISIGADDGWLDEGANPLVAEGAGVAIDHVGWPNKLCRSGSRQTGSQH